MNIKALGGCCAKSTQNFYNIKEAVQRMGLDVEVEQVSDTNEILNYGVMSTPGLVINNRAVSVGKLLSVEDAMALIKRYQGQSVEK
ncbi:MAG TPA: redox-active disulfide protein 2 [Acholeplasmataceae bacterium]|nr:redox-active disulfide protein 2 [Acholeplasmataceae bacterium]